MNRLHADDESTVNFGDLIDPRGLQRALVTTFGLDPQTVLAHFGAVLEHADFKQLTLISDYDRKRYRCGSAATHQVLDAQYLGMGPVTDAFGRPRQVTWQDVSPKILAVAPHFATSTRQAEAYGVQHAKLLLLRYGDRLRIVISSKNFDSMQDVMDGVDSNSQVFWVADVPAHTAQRRQQHRERRERKQQQQQRPVSDFAGSLHDFLSCMEPQPRDAAAAAALAPWLGDFSATTSFNFAGNGVRANGMKHAGSLVRHSVYPCSTTHVRV